MVNRYRTLTSETKTRITDMEVFKDAWDPVTEHRTGLAGIFHVT